MQCWPSCPGLSAPRPVVVAEQRSVEQRPVAFAGEQAPLFSGPVRFFFLPSLIRLLRTCVERLECSRREKSVDVVSMPGKATDSS